MNARNASRYVYRCIFPTRVGISFFIQLHDLGLVSRLLLAKYLSLSVQALKISYLFSILLRTIFSSRNTNHGSNKITKMKMEE